MSKKLLGFEKIDSSSSLLFELSQFLFSNPELAYKETKAHDYLTNVLEVQGFTVDRNFVHETGFRGTFETSSSPHFAILVEYDALPIIGHGCGHNLIAESSIATALGFQAVMKSGALCKLSVFGTPAEEGGGGKIKFVKDGLFDDVDVCIMSHPSKFDMLHITHLACIGLTITYTGKESHAALAPWEGKNALDAAVLAYQSISCLRQQIHPTCRVHGIISNGGTAPNIIPNLAEMKYCIRHPNKFDLKEILSRVYSCFESAAKMTGCTVSIVEFCPLYEDLNSNIELLEIFRKNGIELGISFTEDTGILSASSDVGNVSHVCPTIQPLFQISPDAHVHTKEFADSAKTVTAHKMCLGQAKAMLGTLVDIVEDTTGELLKKIKNAFETRYTCFKR